MNKTIIEEDIDNIVKCNDFSELKNKSVFITGATGLFGLWLLEFLLFLNKKYDFNISITILTRSYNNFISKYPKFKDYNINYIENDVVNFKLNKRYDFFFDLVWAKLKNNEYTYDIMISGIKNVINICKDIEVEKLLFISSGSVYGKQPSNILKITEDTKGIPINDYAKAKKYSEELLLDSKINIGIARGFSFVGAYMKLDYFAMANFIDSVINNRDIIINGDGSPIRSYLYMADAIYWLLTILLKSKNKSIYNVGGGGGISIYDLAKKVAKQNNNYTGEIKVLGKTNIGVAPERYVPDISKIIKELGVKENYTLEAAIKRTIEYYKGL
ncbi:NAD-dependent epimerase/dehydratase family protein [Brachyspira aalborgi]|uniref:NAD(P)-dependent oxidoreductase n=1 Tax=Brachyspira aalborgi TaxID=29522 RepID=A0A5C8EVR1_9SPIR|nr:NAD(P)-dependent oxidoreductase [Brachyspira aalborgi]TXJ41498.1 NAD(P)-dependent oxidoreductase [Brachyspira aalborgi]